jgi:hypothetical protein
VVQSGHERRAAGWAREHVRVEMSDEQTGDINIPALPGEWFVFAAYIQDVLRRTMGSGRLAVVTSVPARSHISSDLGTVNIVGEGNTTTLRIHPWRDDTAPEWGGIAGQIRRFANDMQAIRRVGKPTADEVIERYYRSRAARRRVTLRQLAEETGYNYSYLRDVKVEYDRRGGWGSKKRMPGVHDRPGEE